MNQTRHNLGVKGFLKPLQSSFGRPNLGAELENFRFERRLVDKGNFQLLSLQ